MGIIEVKNLCKDYYQYKVFKKGKLLTRALNNVSFNVKEGDFFGLLGSNGAGKSTLLRILTTNLKKTGGKVYVDEVNIDKNIRKIKERISWMFGVDYEGYGWSSIQKNLMLAANYLGLEKNKAERRVRELLEYFKLYKDRKLDVWRMSSGMAAKYALSVAMLKNPRILFLDEPLLGLDVAAKDSLRDFLVQLNKDGTTIVYTDHQLHEMEKVCKNLIIIEKGDKVYGGGIDSLKKKYRDTHVLELACISNKINRKLINLKKGLKFVSDYDLIDSSEGTHNVKIYTNVDSKKALLSVGNYLKRKGVVIESLNAGLLNLEDVYKKFLNKNPHYSKIRTLHSFSKAEEEPLKSHSKYLKHRSHHVRGAACSAFINKERSEVERILKRMGSLTKEMQIEALKVIGDFRAADILKKVMRKLNKRDKAVKFNLAIARGKIGDVKVVDSLANYLLRGETCSRILEILPDLDEDVLRHVGYKVRKFSKGDLRFLVYHIEKSKRQKEIFNALGIKYENYLDWKRNKKGKFRKIKRR